ncbi:MAG: SemiSWEET transporter [Cytophagales bacterium]
MIYLGFLAATLTTISFIPQVYIVWKTNDTKSISLTMFLLFWIGVVCWLFYGIFLQDFAIICANIFTLAAAGYILLKKLMNLKRDKAK